MPRTEESPPWTPQSWNWNNRCSGPFEVSLSLDLPVVHDRALLAFKHPFVYAASRGIDDNAGLAAVPPATAAQAAN
jgi:hypothetical protein